MNKPMTYVETRSGDSMSPRQIKAAVNRILKGQRAVLYVLPENREAAQRLYDALPAAQQMLLTLVTKS